MNKKLLFILIPIAIVLLIGMIVLVIALNGQTEKPQDTTNTSETVVEEILNDNLPHIGTEDITLSGKEIVKIKISPIGQDAYKENSITLYSNGQVLSTTLYEDGTKIYQRNTIKQDDIDAVLKLCNNAKSFSAPAKRCPEGNEYIVSCPDCNLSIESCGLCSPEAINLFYNIKKILLSEGD